MITQEKINLYRKFAGDIDHVVRVGTAEEKALSENGNWWSMIYSLLQDIHLVKNGLTSQEYADALQKRLLEYCDNSETIYQLSQLTLLY